MRFRKHDWRVLKESEAAFTLVELMIAIALMLLLMVGINVIFKITGQAVGTGQALSDTMRNAQASQAVMNRDFSNMVAGDDAPYIIIYSRIQPAFRNKQDMLSDADYDQTLPNTGSNSDKIRTIDLDGDGKEGVTTGETVPWATYNFRNHRVDVIQFFARDLFRRQTGNPGTYVADQSSLEAMIWYGHLWLPNSSGGFFVDPPANTIPTNPGAGTPSSNPNNFYASQWILGREAILLQLPDSSGLIKDSAGLAQNNLAASTVAGATPTDLTPLQFNTSSNTVAGGGSATIQSSRYDLAGTSIDDFRKRLSARLSAAPPWWFANLNPNSLAFTVNKRFQASPIVFKPVDSVQAAKMTPIFLPGCTQFIVEYAGDYLEQDPTTGALSDLNGNGTFLESDGNIDFVVSPTGAHQIRWYGMPRNVDTSDDTATGPVIRGTGVVQTQTDVVPLHDARGGTPAAFEKIFPTSSANYADPGSGMSGTSQYVCAWGPTDKDKPKMIRVTIVLDDPSGRLGEGQTYEYVFKVQ